MAIPNKSPLKILEKREHGRIQWLRKFFVYPLLFQERVKLRTSIFVGTFTESIGTEAHENVGNSSHRRSQGVAQYSTVRDSNPDHESRDWRCFNPGISGLRKMKKCPNFTLLLEKNTFFQNFRGKWGNSRL